ncbi:MAG: beta-ketoacyl-[acyl-carrier-protein] synthase family protein [Bacteroidales bacterium]|nr:beta-ketoacyl-[acyl-carrier-protein] synthase family protein [Bacteroidales bacterium]
MKRVVITGMGIYSCLGLNKEEVRQSLFDGKSGISIDPVRKEFGFQSALTGVLPDVDLKEFLDRKSRISIPQQGAYAYVATLEALKQSGIDESFLHDNEVGILYGNDSSAVPVITGVDIVRERRNTALIGSGNIFQSMNSTVTMNLSCLFNLRGINFTISGACASGSHAVGLAYLLVKQGLQNIVVCGGAQEVNPYAVGSFDGLSAFSKREDEPTKASRPFDSKRDGLVPSGGAATLIVESYDSAIKRGAPILGEIIGYGFSSNGEHLSVPNIDGPYRSLKMAIEQSGVNQDDIAYINAHATSTHVGDRNEAAALLKVFGSLRPYVASTKSYTGHEMWMAGASEIVYSLLMAHGGFIAPNLNYEEGDDITSQLNIPTSRIDTDFDLFLSNSFGFGGTNSSLVIKKITN